jgi:hypothetical protein
MRITGCCGRANIQGKHRTTTDSCCNFFKTTANTRLGGIGVLRIITTGSGRTYRDKVDNTVMVGNILMNVHG